MATLPLVKMLTSVGLGSRRQMAAAVKAGRITVNGRIAESFTEPINDRKDTVCLDGRPLELKADRPVYLALNKPAGVLSTTMDDRGRRTVLDLLPPKYRHFKLYPVGRLDLDSTGLVILTNDGALTLKLTHPRYEHEKEYLVQVNRRLMLDEQKKLEQGIELYDGVTSPAKIRLVSVNDPIMYSVVLHEGKKRQIRRMFRAVDRTVLSLQRIRIGTLELADLPEGAVRPLSAREIKQLYRW